MAKHEYEHPVVSFNIHEVNRWWEIKMLTIHLSAKSRANRDEGKYDSEDLTISSLEYQLAEKIAELAEFYGVSLDCYKALRERWGGE